MFFVLPFSFQDDNSNCCLETGKKNYFFSRAIVNYKMIDIRIYKETSSIFIWIVYYNLHLLLISLLKDDPFPFICTTSFVIF